MSNTKIVMEMFLLCTCLTGQRCLVRWSQAVFLVLITGPNLIPSAPPSMMLTTKWIWCIWQLMAIWVPLASKILVQQMGSHSFQRIWTVTQTQAPSASWSLPTTRLSCSSMEAKLEMIFLMVFTNTHSQQICGLRSTRWSTHEPLTLFSQFMASAALEVHLLSDARAD